MDIRIVELTAAHFRERADEAISVYIAAMRYPGSVARTRKPAWFEHSHWHGFSAVAALAPAAQVSRLPNDPVRERRCWLFGPRRHTQPIAPPPPQSVTTTSSTAPPSTSEAVVGICYGYRMRPGQWWHDHVAKGAHAAGVPLPQSAVELTELHVHPGLQGHGIGRHLLESFLRTRSEQSVLLSTPEVPEEENLAWHLYRRAGFTDVLRHFHFIGDPRPFAVLGRTLPLPEHEGSSATIE